MKELKKKIHKARNEMINLGEKFGLQSPIVLKKSQELDDLIFKYQKGVIQNEQF